MRCQGASASARRADYSDLRSLAPAEYPETSPTYKPIKTGNREHDPSLVDGAPPNPLRGRDVQLESCMSLLVAAMATVIVRPKVLRARGAYVG